MKKYLSILVAVMLAALSFTLTSCGDDDEDDPQVNYDLLIGTWEETTPLIVNSGETHYSKINADGSLVDVSLEDGEIEISYSKWTRKGNIIYSTSLEEGWEDITLEVEIKELTKTEMVLRTIGITQTFKRVPDSTIAPYL